MGKAMILATVLVVGIAAIFGLDGVLWMRVLAIPIGIVLWIFARLMKWL